MVIYLLVNVYITIENHHAIHGKIPCLIYFCDHYVNHYQGVRGWS